MILLYFNGFIARFIVLAVLVCYNVLVSIRLLKRRGNMFFGRQRLGIDLGTVNTVIYIEGKGVALREPSIVARETSTGKIVAFGRDAKELEGHTSESYEIITPLNQGVISNLHYTKEMLAHFISKALLRKLSSPEVVICAPSNITKLERRAVIDAIRELGIKRAMIVDEPFAAAVGAGLDIRQPQGRLLCDIGGGTTDIAVLSYGEIIEDKMIRVAGQRMNELIQINVREKYRLIISLEEANEIKIRIGNAVYNPKEENNTYLASGRNVATGLPMQVTITESFVAEVLDSAIRDITHSIQSVLELIPPEMSSDILDDGMVLTGGGALIKRLPERLQAELKIPVNLAHMPLDTVAIGAGKMIETMKHKTKHQLKKAR